MTCNLNFEFRFGGLTSLLFGSNNCGFLASTPDQVSCQSNSLNISYSLSTHSICFYCSLYSWREKPYYYYMHFSQLSILSSLSEAPTSLSPVGCRIMVSPGDKSWNVTIAHKNATATQPWADPPKSWLLWCSDSLHQCLGALSDHHCNFSRRLPEAPLDISLF